MTTRVPTLNKVAHGTHRLQWVVIGISAVCSALYIVISLVLYNTYRSGMDLALYGEAVRKYSQGHLPWSAIKAQSPFDLLGDHFTILVAVLAPFYHLWSDVRLLLVAQALLFGVAVWLVGHLATTRLPARQALAIQVGFGLSWGMLNATFFGFHEIALAVPLVAWALASIWRKPHWVQFAIACVLLILTKEDSTFLTAGLGLVLIAQRRIKAGLITGIASLGAFLALVGWLMPHLSATGAYIYLSQNSPGLPSMTHALSSPDFWVFLATLIVTVGLGWRSPLAWAILPTIAARVVADYAPTFRFGYHYNATIMVVCFVAIIDAWSKLRQRAGVGPSDTTDSLAEGAMDTTAEGATDSTVVEPGDGPPVRTAAITRTGLVRLERLQYLLLVVVVLVGLISSGLSVTLRAPAPSSGRDGAISQAIAMIPQGSTVVADEFVIAHLVDHYVTRLAVPGWTDSLGVPLTGVQYVIFDTSSYSLDNQKNHWQATLLGQLEDNGCQIAYNQDSIYLLKC
ncbi:MAG: DUF2079 domain-containing protein [Propionibacteriaceae bacterium]|nr:DUF2079 domain-containing protein [Propionibacteriaceae bacterium]